MTKNKIEILIEKNIFILRFVEDSRFSFAPSLMESLNTISLDLNINEVIFDMNQTRYIDSTIIGTLLNYFLKEEIWSRFNTSPPKIVTQNPDIVKTIKTIGIDIFFPIVDNDPRLAALKQPFAEIMKMTEEKEILEQYIRSSHRTLSKLNPNLELQDIENQIRH